jgi:hypothetical protein
MTRQEQIAALIADDAYAMTFQTLGQYRSALLAALQAEAPPPASPKVGCEREDGLLNIHAESETCEVCAPPAPPEAEPYPYPDGFVRCTQGAGYCAHPQCRPLRDSETLDDGV